MLTVINARYERGHDSGDHNLDDTPLQDMIGRQYRDARAAKRAAAAIARRQGSYHERTPRLIEVDVLGQRQTIRGE